MKGIRARIVRIGNSRGVRLPKPALERSGLGDEVELHVRRGAITISDAKAPRSGWAAAAQEMRRRGEDRLPLHTPPTRFEETEWTW